MHPHDFIYKCIRDQCVDAGASDEFAESVAGAGLEKYQKNAFDRADKLINRQVAYAKKMLNNDHRRTRTTY